MKLASEFDLKDLMGKTVITTREFSGVAVGTKGKVVEKYGDKRHAGIMVRWTEGKEEGIKDGFGRDADFDETQWLEVVA